MALLLETSLGDLVIDLDIEGSPELAKNVLKLAKARYYTSTLVYNVDPNRFCQFGDPIGNGSGGACIQGLIESEMSGNEDVLYSKNRFLKSSMGRVLTENECREMGRVVATEMNGIIDTIGSQFLITISSGVDNALDNYSDKRSPTDQQGTETLSGTSGNISGKQKFRSLGVVTEDENNVLDKLNGTYCDPEGRPYADIRVIRALVIDDPFEDPPNMDRLLETRGVIFEDSNDGNGGSSKVTTSPDPEFPSEEVVERRISVSQLDQDGDVDEEDEAKMREREEKQLQREDKSRATVLEMLGDLPSADIKAPENVLFVCKLNPITEDEDLELIFSRFDEKVKAEIIRDPDTSNSLQYAFVEFSTKDQAVEAYFKMNNTLVDDRRIKVDFSQSVAKVWDRFNQKMRMPRHPPVSGHGSRGPMGLAKPNQNQNNGRAHGRYRGGNRFDKLDRESNPESLWQGRDNWDVRSRANNAEKSEHRRYDSEQRRRNEKEFSSQYHQQLGGSDDRRQGGRSSEGSKPRFTRHRSRSHSRSRSRERKRRNEKKQRGSHHRRHEREVEYHDSDGRRGRREKEDRRRSRHDSSDEVESDEDNSKRRHRRSCDRYHRNNGDGGDNVGHKARNLEGSSSDDEHYSRKRRKHLDENYDRKDRKYSSRRRRDRDKSERDYSSSRRHKHSRKYRHDSRS